MRRSMPPLQWTRPPALGLRTTARQLTRRAGRALCRTRLRGFLARRQEELLYAARRRELRLSPAALPRFDTVQLEVRSRCNGSCSFCAASRKNERRPDQVMSWELYRRIVAELRELDFRGRLTYFVNNDPLLHPEIVGFVGHARQELPLAYIQILTNGLALTVQKARGLVGAGIDELSINWYSKTTELGIPKRVQRVWDEVLPRFYRPERVRSGCYLDPRSGADLRFNLWWRRQEEVLTNRAGSAPNREPEADIGLRGFCEMPFRVICVAADGRVARCPSDFGFRYPLGKVGERSLSEIWSGESYRRLRRVLLAGRRQDDPLCAGCDFYGVCFLERVGLEQRLIRALTE